MDRRQKLLQILKNAGEAVTGAELAAELAVSRQAVVQDVALLRAQGCEIVATPGGYTLALPADSTVLFACTHTGDEAMRSELYAIVDNGGRALDVIVEHGVYGQITAMLNISSRYDADRFIASLHETKAEPLSRLTAGVHLHTVAVPDEGCALRIRAALAQLDILINETEQKEGLFH